MARKAQEINIYRIAEEAGVSVPTVSKVINQKAGVTEGTRNKISEILRRYNFRPVYTKAKTTKIAVIYPWPDLTDYFQKAMRGIYGYAQNNELMISIVIAKSSHKESLLEAVRDQQCSGVIALISELYRNELAEFADSNLPVVIVDSVTDIENFGFIDNDSVSGSSEAAKHLIDLGHKNIGYLTYERPSLNQLQRLKSAENTFKAHGITLTENDIIRLTASETDLTNGVNGFIAMNKLLKQAPNLTAVMACDDSMALGAIRAIHKAGLRIPEDISVVGFDNYPETEYWSPPLTTVDHPIEKAGNMAIEAIHARLKAPGDDWIPPRDILPTSLVIRESTGPAKQ